MGISSTIRNSVIVATLALVIPLLALPVSSCHQTSNPVSYITVFRVRPGKLPLPPPSWGTDAQVVPYPTYVQAVFSPRDRMFLGLIMSKRPKEEITFSSYTFLNKATGEEVEIEATNELGPFEPGTEQFVALQNPWPVPSEPGIYEVRIYQDDKLVASAVFEVSTD